MKKACVAVAVVVLLGLAAAGPPPAGAQGTKGLQVTLTAANARTPAPDFALDDTQGRLVRLSDYRGKVVLLDFWATTCGGCVEEIPIFIEVAGAYGRRGLATVGVSEDIAYANLTGAREAWSRVRPFVRDHKVGYTILMGDSRVTADYDIKALPLTYLIDARGRVAATYGGVVDRANLEANIKTLLAEPR